MSGKPAQHQTEQPGREDVMRPAPDYRPRYQGSARLSRKVALISGGDSGIGRAVAVLFAREGADIAFIYLNETRDADETQKLIELEGGDALAIRGDVSDDQFCKDAVAETVKRFGRLDVLVNNAAEQHCREKLEDISREQLERTFATNLFGYVFLAQSALEHMKKGSAIINTASITAYRGSPTLVDYAATKGAILAFTRSLAAQLVEKGVRVNAVAPGPIWTPLIPASFGPERVAEFGTDTPMGRPGEPNEAAPAFLFLACADSSYMTGQTLHPNGGEPVNG